MNKDLARIKKRIKLLDYKKKKIAKDIGISEVYLSYILNEKRPLTSTVIVKLLKHLSIKIR